MFEDVTNTYCPFWSAYAMKCRLCYEGLFIPLEDHIEVFCTSPEYPLCMQYSMKSDDISSQEREQEDPANRRAFPRIARAYRVTLVQLTDSGDIARHISIDANTVDLSRGGMKLETSEQLIDDSRISYSFLDIFPKEIQSGIARIKWCRKQKGSGDFLAGLAFENPPSQAIGMYLKMTTENQ